MESAIVNKQHLAAIQDLRIVLESEEQARSAVVTIRRALWCLKVPDEFLFDRIHDSQQV